MTTVTGFAILVALLWIAIALSRIGDELKIMNQTAPHAQDVRDVADRLHEQTEQIFHSLKDLNLGE